MKYDPEKDEITFASGRKVYAHRGIVGMRVAGDLDADLVYEGYDGCIDTTPISGEGNGSPFGIKPEDCIEFADHMIVRWTEWRELHRSKL